ncbi:hypothetical protein QBC36DRAFT_337194 [Triangularia setosa]|uniref:Uncharacterized protein n=1 Tax=Triangularia setosa TaxID=2587417 RepID=A0AAN7A4C4_9PEZI|nr:hypothetical protein QBC36DRAFT_337194 [Podospora setosa]
MVVVAGDGEEYCWWWWRSTETLGGRTGWHFLKAVKGHKTGDEREVGQKQRGEEGIAGKKSVGTLTSMRILTEREAFVTITAGALLSAGYYLVLITLGSQFAQRFGLGPVSGGGVTSHWQ